MPISEGLGTLIGAIVGLLAGSITTSLTYQQKNDELFFNALGFLDGGSQKRNLGISAIELYWKKRRHRKLCRSLLTGSAIYLLQESKQGDAAHELYNLKRIMDILLKENVHDVTFRADRAALFDAITSAIANNQNSHASNEKVVPMSEIEKIVEAESELHKLLKDIGKPIERKGLKVKIKDLTEWKNKLV